MGKKDTAFWESAALNNATYRQYLTRLTEISLSIFKWQNLPESIDSRFLELTLFENGSAVFFEDDGGLGFLALPCAANGPFDVYRVPINRRAYASNGYNANLTDQDSVIIYNNYMRTNAILDVKMFAHRLYNIDRAIDVNINAQKTPILIRCDENQRLSLENAYQKYDGNQMFIFGDKSLNPKLFEAVNTQAPYVADKLQEIKSQIWNEALTYLGVANVQVTKKERLTTDEVARLQGGAIASRFSRLQARRDACEKINAMFGLDIWCDFRTDEEPEAEESEAETDG